ncbi:thimet oligopeptidase-like [Eubalaena glacialis]|uniref:thimet oligopeptidase-like n=1 Tax=Eubalaena glacialis TaxID=27606 RepID=UPI002A5A7DDB|nr:thimet oligopeptidase-like [Eubalaena glacialis]XP_061039761.1 thimet oligopeptidase-like [Eubalaena glacialis]
MVPVQIQVCVGTPAVCTAVRGGRHMPRAELLDKLIKSRLANPGAPGPRESKGVPGLPSWKVRPGHSASPPSPSSHLPCLFNLRQIVLGKLDQALHTQTPSYPAQENARLCQEILRVPDTPGTHLPATFGRLAGSYDSQSYGYLCSEVYSADTFHTLFKQEDVLSGKVAMDYRSCILRLGGSKDAKGMVKLFLTCDPTQDAFLLSKGLQVEGCKPLAC